MKSMALNNKATSHGSIVQPRRNQGNPVLGSLPRFYKPAAKSNKRPKKDSDRIQIGNPGLVWAIVAAALAAGITFLLPGIIAAIWLFLTS
jgi:hypothetical protein